MRVKFFIFLFISLFVPFFAAQAAAPIKILLVPGHDEAVWGAQYGNLKEADMNLYLATKIFNLLKKDKRFEVHITRNTYGYTKEFYDYFTDHEDDIASFIADAKEKMNASITSGDFVTKPNTPHHGVSGDIALKLYGINKWADEHGMDAVLHVHFNDYPRKTPWTMGIYKGFTVYMPDTQFANGTTSTQFGESIFNQLHKKYATSTYEGELGGFIHDQKLIALGANNTLVSTVRSVLVEYGYIYRFGNSVMRHKAYTSMADLTVAGIKDYFFPKK